MIMFSDVVTSCSDLNSKSSATECFPKRMSSVGKADSGRGACLL